MFPIPWAVFRFENVYSPERAFIKRQNMKKLSAKTTLEQPAPCNHVAYKHFRGINIKTANKEWGCSRYLKQIVVLMLDKMCP